MKNKRLIGIIAALGALDKKGGQSKNLCEDVDARYHLNYREFPYRSVSQ